MNVNSVKSCFWVTLAFFCAISCLNKTQDHFDETREIVLENIEKDSTIICLDNKGDSLNIFRRLEITENENTDTTSIGNSILAPKYTGILDFSQVSNDSSKAVYIARGGPKPELSDGYSKLFTIRIWGNNVLKKVKLKVRLRETLPLP